MTHKAVRQQLYDYLHDELSPSLHNEIKHHLAFCIDCTRELQVLRSTLAEVFPATLSPADERQTTFWDAFAENVEMRIARSSPAPGKWWQTLFSYLQDIVIPQQRFMVAAGSAMAILGLLWFGSNEWTHRQWVNPEPPVNTGQHVENTVDPMGQYLRRSKVLLVGLSNLRTDDGRPVDLSVERTVSRELIQEARNLGEEHLDPRSVILLRDLRKILVELANMEQHSDLPNVEIIRSGIEQENLLFKIRMAEATRDSVRLIQAKYSRSVL